MKLNEIFIEVYGAGSMCAIGLAIWIPNYRLKLICTSILLAFLCIAEFIAIKYKENNP